LELDITDLDLLLILPEDQTKDIRNESVMQKFDNYTKINFIENLGSGTKINLKFISSFATTNINTLLELVSKNYPNLNISSFKSFYFITEETVDTLTRI
jgi:hypothetical protein